jgi:outer membrane protein
MRNIKHYVLFLFCLAAVGARAQETQSSSYSLQQAIDYALKSSPGHMVAMLEEQRADARRKEVTGMGLPQIKASADAKYYLSIPVMAMPLNAFNPAAPADSYTTIQFGTKYNTTAGLSATQLLFNADYIFGLKAANAYMHLARIEASRSKSDLIANVSKAYYTVLITRDRIQLLESSIERLKKSFEETKAFNEQGFAEMIDVERLEVQYNNLLVQLDNTRRMTGVSEVALKFHMGLDFDAPVSLTDSLNLDASQFPELEINRIDVSSRPDLMALQASEELLNLDVQRYKWGYMPTVAAYGSYQFNRLGNQFDIFTNDPSNPIKQWFRVSLIGITAELNVFDGFQRHNKIQQAKVESLKNQYTRKNVELAAQMESMSAAISYNNSYRSLLSQKRNMELATHVYDVTQKKFAAGVGSNLEVFTAESSLKEAQTNYYIALYDMFIAKIDYQKAIGAYAK